MVELQSRTIKTKNALITVHGYSAGTVILNVTSCDDVSNHAAIWLNLNELADISELLLLCKESNA